MIDNTNVTLNSAFHCIFIVALRADHFCSCSSPSLTRFTSSASSLLAPPSLRDNISTSNQWCWWWWWGGGGGEHISSIWCLDDCWEVTDLLWNRGGHREWRRKKERGGVVIAHIQCVVCGVQCISSVLCNVQYALKYFVQQWPKPKPELVTCRA